MAVTIVQAQKPAQPATSPQVTLNGVVAQHTVFTFGIEGDGNPPGPVTDNRGDTFTLIDQFIHGSGLASCSLQYVLRAVGGRTVVTQPTTAGGTIVAVELAGVATPVQQTRANGSHYNFPDVPDGLAKLQGIDSGISVDFFTEWTNGALVFAMCLAAGNPTITFSDATWNAAASGTAFGLTYDIRTKAVAGAAELTPAWSLSSVSSVQAVALGFPAA